MIDIQISNMEKATLVEVSGRIDSSNADQLGSALTGTVSNGQTQIVLDLSAVEYMSSAGLREIVSVYRKLEAASGDLRIAQPSVRVMDVLEMSGLDTMLQIYPTQVDALGSD
ncbi:MAG: STAS domain-containing protein [Chloroflexi bacterium]|nr:STAS domain-containing protein [Chloroflexota bacterium]